MNKRKKLKARRVRLTYERARLRKNVKAAIRGLKRVKSDGAKWRWQGVRNNAERHIAILDARLAKL